MSTPISAVLVIRDEAARLAAVLAPLSFCAEILVLDSGSTDGSQDLARRLGARVEHQDWLGYGPQKRRAVALARHDWILSIDGDEVLDATAAAAIRDLDLGPGPRAYRLRRRTFVGAREIRHGVWKGDAPIRLFDRRAAGFDERAVHESVHAPGPTPVLPGSLLHHTFCDLADCFRMNLQRLKADGYRQRGRRAGPAGLLVRAGWAFVQSYAFKRGFLDGGPGVVVALAAAVNAVVGLAMASEMENRPG